MTDREKGGRSLQDLTCLVIVFKIQNLSVLINAFPSCAVAADVFQVLVPKRSEFSGKMIEVEIYESGKHFLKGRPVEDSRPFTPSIAEPLQKGAVSGLTQVRAVLVAFVAPQRTAPSIGFVVLMVLMVETGHSTLLMTPLACSPSFLNTDRRRNALRGSERHRARNVHLDSPVESLNSGVKGQKG